MSHRLLATVLTGLIVLNVASTMHARRVVDQGIVIESVTLISPERETPLPRADVVIRDRQIVEVGTHLRAMFKIMLQEHVPVIFGSDTPGVDGFGNPPGLNGRFELQNWADAGAPLGLILRAATIDNAIAPGLSHELGSIEVGKRAGSLLLKENPLANISAYDSIETVFLHGEPIAREELRAHNNEERK